MHYYTFDDDNLTSHLWFFKKDIPIYSFVKIRYVIFGIFTITFYREMLNENTKGTILLLLLCTKRRSLKKLEGFFEVLSRKNMSCVIQI
jgi:hypothetical protein